MLFNTEIQILELFCNDYNKQLYGREISKTAKINQKTVSNILLKLEKENILKYSLNGKNKNYFLNKSNLQILDIIKIIEIYKKIHFLKKHKKYALLFEELEKRTNGICIIFGSYSKNLETKYSDIDIFIIGKISTINDLETMYNLKINTVIAKQLSDDAFSKEIYKNHIILKDFEDYVNSIKW